MLWKIEYFINDMIIPFMIEEKSSKKKALSNATKELNRLKDANPSVDFYKIKNSKEIYVETYILNSKGNIKVKPKSPPKFKSSDFTISPLWATGDNRIAYIFESPTSIFNYFWIIGKEPKVYGLVGESNELVIRYPLVVKAGDKVPNPKLILNSIVTKLNRGEY